MHSRREFLGALSLPALAIPAAPRLIREPRSNDWADIQRAFTVDRSIINLNNGGVSPSPAYVQDAMKRRLDFANECPPYHLWRIQEPRREGVRQRIARQWGVDPEEIALTRNASEGLQICQFGIDLEPGDEVLTTNQDYPRMVSTFNQRARREGVNVNLISIPVPAEDDDVVARFEAAVTPRTRLILICQVINLTGQVLPVRRVVAMARARNIPVIVDGAHGFAHLDFKISDLDCDYYATSLHKWLFAPHGTGLLYVRRDRIRSLWPMMAAQESLDDDIRKFEQIGTHPEANALAVGEALTFNQTIGFARKQARLIDRRDRWMLPLARYDRVRFNTARSNPGGIANVRIDGVDSRALNTHLWKAHRILTTAITHAEFEGIRVSPSVYTTDQELDRFVDVMQGVIENGLP